MYDFYSQGHSTSLDLLYAQELAEFLRPMYEKHKERHAQAIREEGTLATKINAESNSAKAGKLIVLPIPDPHTPPRKKSA